MKLNRFLSLLTITGIVLIISCTKENTLQPDQGNKYVPNQLLVKFKSGSASDAKALSNTLSAIGGEIVETISTDAMRSSNAKSSIEDGKLVLVNSELGTMEAIARLQNLPEIEYAEPNYIYTHTAISNDPYYTNGSLWGMYGDSTSPVNQFGSQAGAAWSIGHTGSDLVYIGIIDEGYMYTHEDLAANAGKNPGETPGDGVDNDGNGYRDDVYGWDFDGNNSTVFDGVNDDHGTHVAGTIGAVGGNGKGVAGINWNVKLLNAKFLGNRGGTTANAIKAVDYFTNLKMRPSNPINIVATNNSWGGGGFSQGLYDAIERANNAGILFIAAAGNATNNNDATLSYPASYSNSNIIAVAAITNNGGLASYSNYGATTVDLGAPGSSIYSTVPKKSGSKVISGYASYSGTSMATPHVTGAVALFAASNPGSTAAQIKDAILNSTIPTSSLSGKCLTGGRLNVSGF